MGEKLNKFKKYAGNKRFIIKNAITWPLIGAGIAGLVIGNRLLDEYDSNLKSILCPTIVDEEAKSEAAAAGEELAVQVEEEGIVLVQNKGGENGRGILPLDFSVDRVNIFGRGAIEWHFSGSGSGGIYTSKGKLIDLVDAFESQGILVNHELIDASTSIQSKVKDVNNLHYSTLYTSKTYEPKIEKYQSAYNAAKSFSDTAIVCFGRYAGEGNDLTKSAVTLYGNDSSRTTLDFSKEEEDLLRNVAQDFKNVIVLINSSNPMNLKLIESIPGVDACLVIGTPGNVGAKAIPNVLWGTVTPCGHLTDTYVYDFKTTPNYYNSGYDYFSVYSGSNEYAGSYGDCSYRNEKISYRGRKQACYVDYDDSIYVGYRWYETADAEGFWDRAPYNGYDNVVQYPFGYGLSYVSNFDWELVPEKCSPKTGSTINENTNVELTVKVTNKDTFYSGKDVVQVYLTAPYDEAVSPIEKSYVSLVGYAKTPVLGPGQSVEVTVKMNSWDFKSFDDLDQNKNSFKGYEMESGDYVLRFRTDSHHDKVMTGGNTITYKVPSTIKITEDKDTKAPIKPVMSGENPVDGISIDGKNSGQNIKYLSRKEIRDKSYTLPTAKPADRAWSSALEVSRGGTSAQKFPRKGGSSDFSFNENRWNTYSQEMARAWDNYGDTHGGLDPFGNPIPTDKPTFGASKKVKLVENNTVLTDAGLKCAADYNDPAWKEVLDGVSYNSAKLIIEKGYSYTRPGISELDIPELSDHDGPSQINTSVNEPVANFLTGYPNPTVVGQTWNEKLAFDLGKSYANDMKVIGVDGAYGFACDIHRTQFGGRNFEYYSEDPFLSGRQASQCCRGVQVSGKSTYLKHFVCNDQETWRCGMYTWLTEQAFREIYAKPFEIVIKDDATTAIMSSFNRVGATWAGGSEGANQGIMRNEWGFHGTIKTDYGEDCDFMDMAQCLRAGETVGLADDVTKSVDGSVKDLSQISPRYAYRIREVVHELAYTYIHALYKNKMYNESDDTEEKIIASVSKEPWYWYKPVVVAFETLVIGGMVVAAYCALRPLDEATLDKPKGKKAKKEAK